MSVLLREAMKLPFEVNERVLKYIQPNKPDWIVSIVIQDAVNPDDGDNWDEVPTFSEIVDDAVEQGETNYVSKQYDEIMDSIENMEKVVQGDLISYEDKGGKIRNIFICPKDKQQEILKFLQFFNYKPEINPDLRDEEEDAENEADDAIRDAEDYRKEMEYMRRASYRW